MIANHYFIDEVNAIIDSNQSEIITITGSGFYEPNRVKNMANNMVRELYPNSKLAAVILTHKQVTLEEYQDTIGKNPPWLGNI